MNSGTGDPRDESSQSIVEVCREKSPELVLVLRQAPGFTKFDVSELNFIWKQLCFWLLPLSRVQSNDQRVNLLTPLSV